MPEICQGDIFYCLCEILGYTQSDIADKLSDKLNMSLYNSRISPVKTKKNKGFKHLASESEWFFETFFKPCIADLSIDEVTNQLHVIRRFVRDNGLEFDNSQGTKGENYKSYVMRMLRAGLSNWSNNLKSKNERQIQQDQQDVKTELYSQKFMQNYGFTGREDLLNEIPQKLRENHLVVLAGMGGIGKTFLAREYAARHSADYDHIQSVACEEGVPSFRRLIQLVKFTGLNENEMADDDLYKKKTELIKQLDERNLIIFDNIDAPPRDLDLLEKLLKESDAHFIITTRLHDFFPHQYSYLVTTLSQVEQRQLFAFHARTTLEESNLSDLDHLLSYVDGHTMIIELIAKNVMRSEYTCKEMLIKLSTSQDDDTFPVPVEKDGHIFYELPFRRLVAKVMKLESLPSEQRELLWLLTILPAEGISRKMLFNFLPNVRSDANILEQMGLVIVDDTGQGRVTRIHPIIQMGVRDLTPYTPEKCLDFSGFIESLCNFIVSDENDTTYNSDIGRLIRSISNSVDFSLFPLSEALKWLDIMGKFCIDMCYYELSLTVSEIALSRLSAEKDKADAKELPKELSHYLPQLHSRVGRLHLRLAHYSSAVQHFQAVLALTEEGSEEWAKCCRNLGEVYRKAADYPNALEYDQRALKYLQNPLDIAEAKNAIGVIYVNLSDSEHDQTKLDTALTYYLDALHLREDNGAPVRELAFSYHNIGTIYNKKGEYLNALSYHKKGLELRRSAISTAPKRGADKESVHSALQLDAAASLTWIGNDYMEMGEKYAVQAKNAITEALDIRGEVLGESHPEYAWSLVSYSAWHEKQGNIKEAISIIKKVIDIRTKVLGPEHKYTVYAQATLNQLESKMKSKNPQ